MNIINSGLVFRSILSKRIDTEYIVLHHAAANNCDITDVHRWHLNKGWAGCGYHFLVRKDGTVYQGRPMDTVGAHSVPVNKISVGICCEGDFEIDVMSNTQLQALSDLIDYVKKEYPTVEVVGHREFDKTACPGKNFPLDYIKGFLLTPKVNKNEVSPWAIDAKKWVVDNSISDGLRPKEPVTREEIWTMLHRLYNKLKG